MNEISHLISSSRLNNQSLVRALVLLRFSHFGAAEADQGSRHRSNQMVVPPFEIAGPDFVLGHLR